DPLRRILDCAAGGDGDGPAAVVPPAAAARSLVGGAAHDDTAERVEKAVEVEVSVGRIIFKPVKRAVGPSDEAIEAHCEHVDDIVAHGRNHSLLPKSFLSISAIGPLPGMFIAGFCGRAWRMWLCPFGSGFFSGFAGDGSEPRRAMASLLMKPLSSPATSLSISAAIASSRGSSHSWSALAKSPRTWCVTISLMPGWPMPMRTRRYSLPQCASMERMPLWPPAPPPVFTRTLPGGRSSSS